MLTVSYDTEIGKYGGTMRLPQDGPGGDPHMYIGSVEPLVWAPGAFNYDMGIYGNVLADWEVNDDNTVFTMHMREGLKWSDGQPVTTGDVDFAWNDVITNEEITAAVPGYLRTGSSAEAAVATVDIIDDYTFESLSMTVTAVSQPSWPLPNGAVIRTSSNPHITCSSFMETMRTRQIWRL